MNFINCLFKGWKFRPWKLIPCSHSCQLTLDEACVASGLFREGCELPSWQKEAARALFPPESPTILVLGKFKAFAHFWVSLSLLQTLFAYPVPLWDQQSNQGPLGLSSTAGSHLDVPKTWTCQGQITMPFSAPVMAEVFLGPRLLK